MAISRLIVAGLLVGLMGLPSASHGEEPSSRFVATDDLEGYGYQGLLDTETGLVWGKDINVFTGLQAAEGYVAAFYFGFIEDSEGNTINPPGIEFAGPIDPVTGDRIPYTDWRPPTVGEVRAAIAAGLFEHLDFSYYRDGRQGLMDVMDAYHFDLEFGEPEDYGDAYFWTTCIDRWKSISQRYKVRFSDEEDVVFGSGTGWVIAVRGQPANHDHCPGKHAAGDDKPGKSGKPPK